MEGGRYMSDGGTVTIYSTDNEKLRNDDEYIAQALNEYNEDNSTPSDPIVIDESSSIDQVHLISNYPNISWVAYMDELCEQPNTVFIYLSPQHATGHSIPTGFYMMRHVEFDTVIRTNRRSDDEAAYVAFQQVMKAVEENTNVTASVSG